MEQSKDLWATATDKETLRVFDKIEGSDLLCGLVERISYRYKTSVNLFIISHH